MEYKPVLSYVRRRPHRQPQGTRRGTAPGARAWRTVLGPSFPGLAVTVELVVCLYGHVPMGLPARGTRRYLPVLSLRGLISITFCVSAVVGQIPSRDSRIKVRHPPQFWRSLRYTENTHIFFSSLSPSLCTCAQPHKAGSQFPMAIETCLFTDTGYQDQFPGTMPQHTHSFRDSHLG